MSKKKSNNQNGNSKACRLALPRAVIRRFTQRLHRDQNGTISILTVFTMFMFTMLLVMIVNVARHLDDKVKMQNAADASAYSGGVVLARGMNSIAFTNHLLGDVFAMTAYLREGRDRQAESLSPSILDAYQQAAEKFSTAPFPKFAELGVAMQDKVQMERELLASFGEMTQAVSELSLPVFEAILAEEMIPRFQHTVLRTIPDLAQQTAGEVAYRHGFRRTVSQQPLPNPASRPLQTGVLWRTQAVPVGSPNEDDPRLRTLPAFDPGPTGSDYAQLGNAQQYFLFATLQRRELAKHYLERWIRDKLRLFATDAEMSQLINLWRIFTCAQLDVLLDVEYPETNLPMLVRVPAGSDRLLAINTNDSQEDINSYLDDNYNFVAVVYRKHFRETGPGLFRNPLAAESDAITFTQVTLFLPYPRRILANASGSGNNGIGGSFGYDSDLDVSATTPSTPIAPGNEIWSQENWPLHWDMLNQNWMVKLVPATNIHLADILQAEPQNVPVPVRVPNLQSIDARQIRQVNNH